MALLPALPRFALGFLGQVAVMKQRLARFCMGLTRVQRAIRHFMKAAFMLFAILQVMLDAHTHYFLLDFAPEHFQRFLDRLLGVLGSFCFFFESRFLIPKERAQYESPLLVPGFTVAPFCPYETFLPDAVVFTFALPFLGVAILYHRLQ